MSAPRVWLVPALIAVLWTGIVLPHLIPWPRTGADWSWFLPVANFDDELYYVAHLKHVLVEGRVAGNAYIKEHADDSYLQPSWNEAALALLSRPFGLRFRAIYMWVALLFSAAFVPLARALLRTMDLSEGAAAVGLALVIGGLASNLNRMIHPQADCFLLLVLVFLATRKIWLRTGGLGWGLLGGAAAGALAYTYPFFGLYADAMTFSLLAWTLRGGDNRARPFAVMAGLAFLLSLPFAWHVLALHRLPQYAEVLTQNGFLASRFPTLRASLVCVLGALASGLLAPSDRPFFVAAFLAALACLNMHVVTGSYLPMVAEHFRHAYRLPWALVSAAILDRQYPGLARRWGGWVLTAAAGVFLGYQARAALAPDRAAFGSQAAAYMPAIQWLNAAAPAGSVVVVPDYAASLVAAFSTAHTFTGPYAYASITPQSELTARKFAELRLFQADEGGARRYALEHPLGLWGYDPISRWERARAHNRLRRLVGRAPVPVPDAQVSPEELGAMLARYRAFAPAQPFLGFQADYVMAGPWEAGFPGPTGLKETFKDPQVRVWSLR